MSSMIKAAYHLDQARTSIAAAVDHLHLAERVDVDPEVAGPVYVEQRTRLLIVDLWCDGLIKSRQPDLDRERAAIDAEREAS